VCVYINKREDRKATDRVLLSLLEYSVWSSNIPLLLLSCLCLLYICFYLCLGNENGITWILQDNPSLFSLSILLYKNPTTLWLASFTLSLSLICLLLFFLLPYPFVLSTVLSLCVIITHRSIHPYDSCFSESTRS